MRANDVTRFLRERGGYRTAAEVAAGLGVGRELVTTWLRMLAGEGKVERSRQPNGDARWRAVVRRDELREIRAQEEG